MANQKKKVDKTQKIIIPPLPSKPKLLTKSELGDKDCSYYSYQKGLCTPLEYMTNQYAGDTGIVSEHTVACGHQIRMKEKTYLRKLSKSNKEPLPEELLETIQKDKVINVKLGRWTYYLIRRELEDTWGMKYVEFKVYDLEFGLIHKEKAYPSTTQEIFVTEEKVEINPKTGKEETKKHRKKVEFPVMKMNNEEYQKIRLPHVTAYNLKMGYYDDVK